MEPVGFEPTSIAIFITMSNPEGPIDQRNIIIQNFKEKVTNYYLLLFLNKLNKLFI